MFMITRAPGGVVVMSGRLDAHAADQARALMNSLEGTCRVDCTGLDYIASVGLGILAATQKRLLVQGGQLILVDLNPHLREILMLAGFESVFRFE